MRKSEKHLKAWKNGAKFDVPWESVKQVLDDYEVSVRPDGENHWIAYHERLRTHPQFPLGRFKINAHFKKQGIVHPSAIGDVLKAVKHLGENNDDES